MVLDLPNTQLGRAALRMMRGSTPLERAEGERDLYDALAEQWSERGLTDEHLIHIDRLSDKAFDAEQFMAACRRDEARVLQSKKAHNDG